MSLQISKQLSLPLDAARWTFGFLAIKEAGKTYDASVLAEEMINNQIPIVAIDGMGIWWGLRVGIDGHVGMPVVIFGGDHKDISIPSTIGKDKHLIVDEERLRSLVNATLQSHISAVLDTTEFSKKQQRRIVTIFVEELYQKNAKYGVRHVFIEETDMWCPQRVTGDISQTVGAVEDLVRRGGNFNLGCTLISQRAAVVNKDILTQINTLVALRILADADKKVVKTWVQSVAHPDDPKIEKWYDSLRDLANGEAWIWHPEKPELFKRIQFRKRQTLHASREYYRQAKWEQENIKLMDVGEFISKFKNVFEPKPKAMEKPKEEPRALFDLEHRPPPPLSLNPPIRTSIPEKEIPRMVRLAELQEEVNNLGPGNTITVQQSLPIIKLEQFKPTLGLSVEALDQPTTPLGRVVVILWNHNARPDRWTIKGIAQKVREHAWEDTGVEQAVDQLIRWEIIKKQSNNYLKFYADRVQIVEREVTIGVR